MKKEYSDDISWIFLLFLLGYILILRREDLWNIHLTNTIFVSTGSTWDAK